MHSVIDSSEPSTLTIGAKVALPQHETVENCRQLKFRTRKRTLFASVVSSCVVVVSCVASTTTAMSTQTAAVRSAAAPALGGTAAPSFSTDEAPALRPPALSWTDTVLQDDYNEELLDFQELQRSTGSDVLQEDLQKQIDAGPAMFLDVYSSNEATMLEKVAMSSVPQQLPKRAVSALQQQTKQNKKSSKKIQDLDFAQTGRVTPSQELELARLIQKGVHLHKIKTDMESDLGRDITRTEWTEAAQVSVKELRQTVSDYRRAKQLLVTANMGLVHAVVKNLRSQSGGSSMTYEEMVQEGSLGLLRAAELFDPSRGLRFSTYATIWIKGILGNSHSAEYITLPQREKTKWSKIRKAHDDFVREFDREPTPQELSAQLGMNVEEFLSTKRKMTQAQQVLSLDYEYQTSSRSGAESSSRASLQNDKAFMADVDIAERTQLHADVVAALARNLDAREARLMRLRYGLSDGQTRTISECAEAMGLSQTRTQQIAQQCLKKLRQAAEMESLQEYLLTIA